MTDELNPFAPPPEVSAPPALDKAPAQEKPNILRLDTAFLANELLTILTCNPIALIGLIIALIADFCARRGALETAENLAGVSIVFAVLSVVVPLWCIALIII